MKKLIYFFCALLTMMLSLVSCTGEEVLTECVQVTFTAKIPGSADSRSDVSFGKGEYVNKLYCAIYEKGDNGVYTFVHPDVVERSGDGFTYSPYLSKGKTYKIAFWAMTEGAYVMSTDLKDIIIPTSVSCNDHTKEAFAGVSDDVVVDASYGASIAVELKRPFAMLNFATTMNTAQKAGVRDMNAAVTITCSNGLAESYNVLTGEVALNQNKTSYTFSKASILGTSYRGDDNVEYIRLASCYVMPVGTDMTVTASIVVKNGDETIGELTEPEVPLTVNYSTNLYGKLLN